MTNILPTLVRRSDGWTLAAANESRLIRGKIIVFSDWHWTIRGDPTHIDGRELVAFDTVALWQKWVDKKPADHILREPGRNLPERDELGDLNRKQWEAGPDGEPKDPWSNTRLVYLVDPDTAEAFTFSTSSWGGRGAVADLADQITRMRFGKPGAVPVVELSAAPMQTKFGRKSKPFLKVMDWRFAATHELNDDEPEFETPAGCAAQDEILF